MMVFYLQNFTRAQKMNQAEETLMSMCMGPHDVEANQEAQASSLEPGIQFV